MKSVDELKEVDGIARACDVLGVPRATYYRWKFPTYGPKRGRPRPRRALSDAERKSTIEVLHSDRFADRAPQEVYATLLDEGMHLCSIRTMYRILHECQEVCERRDQLRHPARKKPQLLANGPNQVWSWDITKLLGPEKWTYFYLYVLMDIFSRYVVGWLVAEREAATLAAQLIETAVHQEGVDRDALTIHADRGAPMTAKTTAQMCADLGVLQSFNRPYTSSDNPYSESHFKTLKYSPSFPDRFGSTVDVRAWCTPFFDWYNYDHRHGGIALLTPAMLHRGQAPLVLNQRRETLRQYHSQHPERFVRGDPVLRQPPENVWINPPCPKEEIELVQQ